MDIAGFVSGCFGGGAGVVVGQPFDTIKVRMQMHQRGSDTISYKGVTDCFVKIIKYESVFGLYKGLLSPLLGVSAQNALIFGVQRTLLKYADNSLASEFYAGVVTGALLSFVSSPVEFTKIQMQMQNTGTTSKVKDSFTGPFHVLNHFYKREGIKGTMRGFNITLLRDTPSYGVYFYLYAYVLETLRPVGQSKNDISIVNSLVAGGICGCTSWAMIYPIDVVKSRIQSEGFKPHGKYHSSADVFRECYRDGGYKTFTRGLGVTLVRAFPVNAAVFCVVDLIEKTMLHQRDDT